MLYSDYEEVSCDCQFSAPQWCSEQVSATSLTVHVETRAIVVHSGSHVRDFVTSSAIAGGWKLIRPVLVQILLSLVHPHFLLLPPGLQTVEQVQDLEWENKDVNIIPALSSDHSVTIPAPSIMFNGITSPKTPIIQK